MIRAVEGGSSCIIFPEGRITTTGSLMKVYEGPAVIAERTRAALVLVRIEGAEFTPFSRLANKVRRRLFPKIRLRVLPPRRLTAPDGLAGRKRRVALRRGLADEMVKSAFAAAPIETTLFDALLEARQLHGGGHVVLDDLDYRPMTYRGLVTASHALGRVIAKRTQRHERVGVLLPTSKAAVVTFFGLQSIGRVPAMLNFSTGATSAIAACRAAEISLVLTSRRFVEKAKLGALVTALESHTTIVYLEDLRGEIGALRAIDGIVSLTGPRRPASARARRRAGSGSVHIRL